MQLIRGQPDWLLSDRQHHEAYSGSTCLLPELPLIGSMHLLDALPNSLVPHAHPGIFEAHFVVDGSLGFQIGGQTHDVNGGMVFLTKPGELHSGVNESLQPARWHWIHIHFPDDSPLPGMSELDSAHLHETYRLATLRSFSGSDQLRSCFERLLAEHRSPRAHSELIARGVYHELLVLLTRDHDAAVSGPASNSISPEIAAAIRWLERHLEEPLSIPDMAQASGLSQSHFRQRCHAETGFTPSDYLSRERVRQAKILLSKPSAPITDIAFRLGFQSSAYFAAVFKKLTGMTPSEYRHGVIGPASRDGNGYSE